GEEPLRDLTQFVDPQLGSVHGRWFFYTPASIPFGMAKLAPHTNAYNSAGGWGPTGYDDRHTSIEGFGHFHEFQIGGLVFMPTAGALKTIPGSLENPDGGYRSRFDKESEHAEAGYYQVFLKDQQIKAELTATERVGYHRYTFTNPDTAHLIIDLGHKQGESGDVVHAFAQLNANGEVEGAIETYPEYAKFCDPGKTVKMFFVARCNKVPTTYGTFIDTLQRPESLQTAGRNNGLYLTFSMNQGELLEVQTGLSYTSIENARLNLDAESQGKTFDEVHQEAKHLWNKKLNRIIVEGGTPKDRIKFYTGLYHALLGRGQANDVNGNYPKVDGQIGQIPLDDQGVPTHNHYNTDGMWGGFWNLSQIWALAYPEYLSNYVQSNIDFYKDRGWLHDGEAAGVFTNGVQTNFQGLLMASAHHAGVRDFDIITGYEAAKKNELDYQERNLGNGKYDLAHFVKNGYIPYKDTTISNGWVFNFGSSHTLEYSFSSYAVSELAKELGYQEDHRRLRDQADFYKNLFDPETKFIRPKLEDGTFLKDFDPMKAWDGFQEGNAFQFSWFVPHDPAGLMKLIGRPLFNERLEKMFEDAQKSTFGGSSEEIHSFSGVDKLYNHGNQPCLHNAWLFNYSGKPWLTQKWVRTICQEFYGVEPLHGYGFGQDEDQGQLGAWFVMSAMGLFDVQGHASSHPSFQFGSPLFERITIKLNQAYYQGENLEIKTVNQQPDNHYVQSGTWNGEEINSNWMYRDRLMQGGKLTFILGPDANENWGISTNPPSMTNDK
ncbi:MAG: glycoside hydrolase family 92 protein, partial [Saprospiraceae bacterium]|nr:glycoside hydrolase family 92 protein [Saprospiraceae bacterium]